VRLAGRGNFFSRLSLPTEEVADREGDQQKQDNNLECHRSGLADVDRDDDLLHLRAAGYGTLPAQVVVLENSTLCRRRGLRSSELLGVAVAVCVLIGHEGVLVVWGVVEGSNLARPDLEFGLRPAPSP
jgi:hypothetical protein